MATYFNKALNLTNASLLKTMRTAIGDHSYDTIVGTGLSGTIFTARVAPTLKKKFAIVRKKDDLSTHSSAKVEGQVGEKWIFVDDFVSGGGTFKRVLGMMKGHHPNCEFAGIYQYERGLFMDPYQARTEYGLWVLELSIGVPFGPLTRAEFIRRNPYNRVDLMRPVNGWPIEVRRMQPLAPLGRLQVDYPDENGIPTLFDLDASFRLTVDNEPRIKPIVDRVLEVHKANGTPLRRMVGVRADMIMRETAKRKPTVVPPSWLDYPTANRGNIVAAPKDYKPWVSVGFDAEWLDKP